MEEEDKGQSKEAAEAREGARGPKHRVNDGVLLLSVTTAQVGILHNEQHNLSRDIARSSLNTFA